ncbi:AlpA family phage regulatory protein [Candidatus Puniceispirillum sp.]|nr:AlpA family phage regulatory protein [Candidatus Puniceispirillum sp.]
MIEHHNNKSISAALHNARALSDQTLIRPRGAAAMLGISRKHLYALAEQPDFPPRIYISDRVVAWRVRDLEEWINNRPVTNAPTKHGGGHE